MAAGDYHTGFGFGNVDGIGICDTQNVRNATLHGVDETGAVYNARTSHNHRTPGHPCPDAWHSRSGELRFPAAARFGDQSPSLRHLLCRECPGRVQGGFCDDLGYDKLECTPTGGASACREAAGFTLLSVRQEGSPAGTDFLNCTSLRYAAAGAFPRTGECANWR